MDKFTFTEEKVTKVFKNKQFNIVNKLKEVEDKS